MYTLLEVMNEFITFAYLLLFFIYINLDSCRAHEGKPSVYGERALGQPVLSPRAAKVISNHPSHVLAYY